MPANWMAAFSHRQPAWKCCGIQSLSDPITPGAASLDSRKSGPAVQSYRQRLSLELLCQQLESLMATPSAAPGTPPADITSQAGAWRLPDREYLDAYLTHRRKPWRPERKFEIRAYIPLQRLIIRRYEQEIELKNTEIFSGRGNGLDCDLKTLEDVQQIIHKHCKPVLFSYLLDKIWLTRDLPSRRSSGRSGENAQPATSPDEPQAPK